ncbi:MAG: hypothetical protein H0U16_05675 [Actinobacteria bacterium]|nr:hypothetical protein [Actinomycetota bacterium]
MTPGEYTQLSGRAGRRGIDEIGHSVVLLQRFVHFDAITRLASTRTYPLQSSFRPSYNMAVNLVRNYDRAEAEHLVNSSLAQWQADRDVVKLEQTRERSEAYLATYRERMQCDLGNIEEYLQLFHELRRLEKSSGERVTRRRNERVNVAISRLTPGDVIDIYSGKKQGRYVVVALWPHRSERSPRVLGVSEERRLVRFSPADFTPPPAPIGHVSVPAHFDSKDKGFRRQVASQLAGLDVESQGERPDEADSTEVEGLIAFGRRVSAHPCHGCPEIGRHIHFSDRAVRLEREISGIDRRISHRTGTLARRFEQVLEVLQELDYVSDWRLTEKGRHLTGVYNEADLLVVEAVEQELLDDLSPPELAAVCSALVFERRGPDVELTGEMPTEDATRAWNELKRLWHRIRQEEEARGLDLTREPDPGFARRAHAWASGAPLERVLDADDAAGDFVRSIKQLIDLMRQLEEIASLDRLRENMRSAVDGVQRGVVAYSSLEL